MNARASLRAWIGLLLAVALTDTVTAQADPVANGRRLFRGDPVPPSAMLEGVSVRFACQQCHARDGRGRAEAGIAVPSVRWRDLQHPLAGARGYADAAAIARAVTDGIGRDGRRLRAPMPRYALSATEVEDLLDYLKVLGTVADSPPGLEDRTVRVASILPLSGALTSTGQRIERAMRARVAAINDQGGIYGRRLDLTVVDGGSSAASLDAAVARVKQEDHALALVGSYLPGAAASGASPSDMPMLHSLGVPLAEGGARDSWLLASVGEQARQLADLMATQCAGAAATRVIYDGTPAVQAALLASDFAATDLQSTGKAGDVHLPVHTGASRWIVLLPSEDLQRFRGALAATGGCLGSLAVVSGVATPPHGVSSPLREYVALPVPSTAAPGELWPLLGDAAIQAFAETLARTGREFDRDDLQAASASLRGVAIGTGLTLNYDRRRRHALDVGFAATGGSHGTND